MVVSSSHGHGTQAAAYAKLRLIYTIIFSNKKRNKNIPLGERHSSCPAILPTRDIMALFLKRTVYASWTQNCSHHSPDACAAPDAPCVGAFNHHPCWPCPTWEDDLTPG